MQTKVSAIMIIILLSGSILTFTLADAVNEEHPFKNWKALVDAVKDLQERVTALEESGGGGNHHTKFVHLEDDEDGNDAGWNPDGDKPFFTIIDEETTEKSVIGVTVSEPELVRFMIIDNIDPGFAATHVAVDPENNLIYAGGSSPTSGDIAVIDGEEDVVIDTIDLGVDDFAFRLAINLDTNRLYATIPFGDAVIVVDTTSNTVIDAIDVAERPRDIAVNPVTNMVYVSNEEGTTVTVIDGSTNSVIDTIEVGNSPNGVAVNSVTNTIYVTNLFDDTISVIDGTDNSVVDTIPLGGFNSPRSVAVNQETNLIYVTGVDSSRIFVIDGSTNSVVDSINAASRPDGISVDPNANLIYVASADDFGSFVAVIDGDENEIIDRVSTDNSATTVAVNPATAKAYTSSNPINVLQFGIESRALNCGASDIVPGSEFKVKCDFSPEDGSVLNYSIDNP